MTWWQPSTWGNNKSDPFVYAPFSPDGQGPNGGSSGAYGSSWDNTNQSSYETVASPSIFSPSVSLSEGTSSPSWSEFGQGLSNSLSYFGQKLSETGSGIKDSLGSYLSQTRDTGAELLENFTESPIQFALGGLETSTVATRNAFDSATETTVQAWDNFNQVAATAKEVIETYSPSFQPLAGFATFDDKARSFIKNTDVALNASFESIKFDTLKSLDRVDTAIDQWTESANNTASFLEDVGRETYLGTKADLNAHAATFADWAVDGYYSAGRQITRWNQFGVDFDNALRGNMIQDGQLGLQAFARGAASLGATAGGLLEATGEVVKEGAAWGQQHGSDPVQKFNLRLAERAAWGMEQSGMWLRNEASESAEWWLETPGQPFTTRLWQEPGETILRSGGELLPSLMLFGGMSGAQATMTGATIGTSNGMLRGKEDGRAFDERVVDGMLTGGLSAATSLYGGQLADKYTPANAVNGPIIEAATSGVEEAGNILLDWYATGTWPTSGLDRFLEAIFTAGASSAASRGGSSGNTGSE